MAVYVMTHKKYNKIPEHNYKDMLVGAYRGHVFGDYFDDEKDNISEKNANYCELTGMYWIWKNIKKDSYIGIVHYRRFFNRYWNDKKKLTDKDIRGLLEKYDIIMPFKSKIEGGLSVIDHFCEESGYRSDMDKVRHIIQEKYSDYLEDYDQVLQENTVYFFNMMICNKNLYDEYCEWLFTILFELEKQVDLTGYTDYQKRIYGFISERLLNVWVRHKQLKICEIGVVNTEEYRTPKKKFLMAMKRVLLYRVR